MLGTDDIAAVERRAGGVRLTMAELCELARVHHSTWSRAKTRGRVRIAIVRRLEAELDRLEAAQGVA